MCAAQSANVAADRPRTRSTSGLTAYFKTKDQLVWAAIDSHAEFLGNLTEELDRLDSPGERL